MSVICSLVAIYFIYGFSSYLRILYAYASYILWTLAAFSANDIMIMMIFLSKLSQPAGNCGHSSNRFAS